MSETNVNSDEAAARARALIEADVSARVEAVRLVAESGNNSDAAEARFRDAAAAHENAWKAALAAGWSEKDLRATGVRAPGSTPAKPRKPRATRTQTVANDSTQKTE
jgi:hypothetical protein